VYPSIPWSFLGLSRSETSYEKAKFIVIPIPYDTTESYRPGSRNGPHQIIDASRYVEFFDVELKQEPYEKGIFTLDEMETVRGNVAETLDRIRFSVRKVLDDRKTPILIGGEHTVTLGGVNAFPKDILVVVLDAHADLRDSYEGDKFSHACVIRRIIEDGRSVVEIGVRSLSQDEFKFAEEKGLAMFYRERLRKNLKGALNAIRRLVDGKTVYLSFDVDVLDPSEAPAVSTPEPDGLTFWEAKEIIREVCCSSEVCGVDMVEVTPIPGSVVTEFLAAKMLYKIVGYVR